jgi:hypothetical protein
MPDIDTILPSAALRMHGVKSRRQAPLIRGAGAAGVTNGEDPAQLPGGKPRGG